MATGIQKKSVLVPLFRPNIACVALLIEVTTSKDILLVITFTIYKYCYSVISLWTTYLYLLADRKVWTLKAKDYLNEIDENAMILVFVRAKVEPTGQMFIKEESFPLDKPELDITVCIFF